MNLKAACLWLSVPVMMLSPVGCADPQRQEEARVLEIAREAVTRKGEAADEMDFGKPVRQPDGSWRVWFSERPAMPDGGRVITISAEGKATAEEPAYPAVRKR